MKKTIFITMGDPRGIGPEIIFRSLKEIDIKRFDIKIIGCRELLEKVHARYNFTSECVEIIGIEPVSNPGAAALASIDAALDRILENRSAALVTGPVEKKVISDINDGFRGHTEYIASRCGVSSPVMSFVTDRVKISLLTTHVPVSAVPSSIKKDMIIDHVKTVSLSLEKYFGIKSPCIAVCSVNPHRGEDGLIGREEKDEMIPALEKLSVSGINVNGPFNADFALKQVLEGKVDFVVSVYHDQLLPAVKAILGPSVNFTMGLGFVRTSPDHGPATDLPPGSSPDHSSMKEAIKLAFKLAG